MPHPIEPSTLRILNAKGQTIGTGFLVSKTLAVTCVHVALSASMDGENRIRVQFRDEKRPVFAKVLDEFFDIECDVAILQVDEVPAGISPLRLGRAGESRLKNDLYTFGYAIAAGEQGIGGLGTFIRQDSKFIQFRMHEADHGHSGAPLYDDKRGVVVGMVKKGKDETGRNDETTFAIPSETIWQVCPQLKPPTTVLPRRNPIVEGINLLPYDYDQRIQNFLGEYLGSDAHPVPFGGRDDALQMLDNWLTTPTPYLLLAAPAGRGKSAMLVRWLDSLSSREDLALAFVPVSIRFGTNMERVLYAALAARLAFLHGDDVPASPETSTAVYRGLVSDYLSKPLANGRTLLVVLDGLDEAADWQAGADFMPAELPTGVRVVVSARFLAGDTDSTPWLHRLNWEHSSLASAPSLVPLDRAGVADVLLKMGCPLDELSRDVDIVAELYRLSTGDPLLVSLYVRDLWAKGAEVTRLKPEDLAGIQPGYKGYFDRWWDDQKKLWGKEKPWLEKHVRAVRNMVAGALGALFLSDIHALDPELESDYIADALDVLQRFIIGDNQSQGYTFSHPKLGQYFWDALTTTEQAQVEGRFLALGEQTLQEFTDGKRDPRKKAEVPAYVVRNYGAHLTRGQQPIEKWLPLVHHQQWAQAWFTIEGAYGGYLQDVNRVWEQCKELDRETIEANHYAARLGTQICCALIEASLHSLAGNIPSKLIWPLVRDGLWTLSQTWVFIRQMPEYHQQANAIIALISHLDDKQLLEALEAARGIQDEIARARVLSILMQHLPEIAEEAFTVALAINHETYRYYALSDLAKCLPKEELEKILAVVPEIRDEGSRARVLSTLTYCLPDEYLEQALAIAQKIENGDSRAIVWSTLAWRMPDLTGDALRMARAIQREESRAYALSSLAHWLPDVIDEALIAAQTVSDVETRPGVLCDLAQRLPAEYLERVLALALEMMHEYEMGCADALIDLTYRLPEEHLKQVLTAALAMKEEHNSARVLSALVYRLPDEYLEQALASVQKIEDGRLRADALSALAHRLQNLTEEALTTAKVIGDETAHIDVLSALIPHLSEEELDEMLVLAREIKDKRNRAYILSQMAQRLPGIVEEALVAVQVVESEYTRAELLGTLARQITDSGLPQLLTEVSTIRDEWCRASVLSELAQNLPEKELWQILGLAREIDNKEDRARVLSALAKRLPQVAGEALATVWEMGLESYVELYYADFACGMIPYLPEVVLRQILDTARTFQNEWAYAKLLSSLAPYLPEVTGEVLGAIRKVEHLDFRLELLSTLAQHLPEVADEVLVAAQAINEESRSDLLSTLAQRLPKEELGQVLDAARDIQYDEFRVGVLSTLAERLPQVVPEALPIAYMLEYHKVRADILSRLVQPLTRIPKKECYLYIEIAIRQLAQRKRDDLFSDLLALMPVLTHLGTDDTPREIYEAVRDVTTWWP